MYFLFNKHFFIILFFSTLYLFSSNGFIIPYKNIKLNKFNYLNNINSDNINLLNNKVNINISFIGLSHINNTVDLMEKFILQEEEIQNITNYMYLNNYTNEINFFSTCNRF